MGLILTIMANGTLSTHPDEPTVHPEATVGRLVADKMCVWVGLQTGIREGQGFPEITQLRLALPLRSE